MTATARATSVIAGALLATLAVGVSALGARRALPAAQKASTDASYAAEVLAAARGASSLACELMVHTMAGRWGGGFERQPDALSDYRPHLHWIMQRTSDPGSVPPLRRGLADPDPCVRRIAPRLLGRSRHPQARRALLDALRSPNPTVRQGAAVGLGYGEDLETVNALCRALRDDHPAVRAAVEWAIGRIRATSPDPEPPPVFLTGNAASGTDISRSSHTAGSTNDKGVASCASFGGSG